MSEIPYIQFYPGDYFKDTVLLTTEQHGAYLLLLFSAWGRKDCKLPDDDQLLARATRLSVRKWKSIKPTIMEFFEVENGYIFNLRLLSEHQKATHKRDEKVSAGRLGGKAKSLNYNKTGSSKPPQKDLANGKQNPSKSEPDSEPYKKDPLLSPKGDAPDLFEKPKSKPKRSTQIPDDFPDATAKAAAAKFWKDMDRLDLDVDAEALAFRDNKLADGKSHKDWKAAWRTWIRNAPRFKQRTINGFNKGASNGTRRVDPGTWQGRIEAFSAKSLWNPDWGPKPTEPGCYAPAEVLQQFNERERA